MSGEAHLDYWIGHDVARYSGELRPPFPPRRCVAYGCTMCGAETDWHPERDEGLAVELIRAHQIHDCAATAAAGPLPATVFPARPAPSLELASLFDGAPYLVAAR